jgi:ATP-binding protein involved in chromosome partitioning
MPLKVLQTEAIDAQVIAIAAGKGGVGKSTLTVLLAAALKRKGERTAILDADLYGPSIRHMLGADENYPPERQNDKWLPALCCGIKVFSYAFFTAESAVRAPIANQVMRQFLNHVVWGPLDWLFIDFPPGTGDIPLSAVQLTHLQGAIIVTTPQKVSLLDVKKTIAMFRKMGVPILGIVENMSYFIDESCTPFGSGGGQALAEEEGVAFLGRIPIEPAISTYADSGKLAQLELPGIASLAECLKDNREGCKKLFPEVSLADRKHLKIVWENGTISYLQAKELQKACPCAQCSLVERQSSDSAITSFTWVGRYGLSFEFSSGCSSGIYPFDLIKRVALCA